MPPRKNREKPVLPDFKEATSEFTFNTGFRYGMADNPPQLGEIPTPVGAPGCLNGITFTVTGTLPSLTREDCKDLIEQHGGRVTSAISGLTDVLIRGCIEVGPKKLADGKSRGLKIIDQESLFDYLISTNKDWKPPPPKTIEGGIELPTENFPLSSLLSEKYRPRFLKDVVGNTSSIKHMIKFFDDFENFEKPSMILSGPPGIGKSTCAALVALYKGYEPIEFNASDTRSKKAIGLDVADIFSNKSIKSMKAEDGTTKKHCLIFDEIDGMSTGDRGGLQELVKLIDGSQIPVICICNDRNNKKLQTLANHSVDIKFSKPMPEHIADRLRFIADQEKIQVSDEKLLDIARAADGDIRHAINTLQFWLKSENEASLTDKEKDGKVIVLNDVIDACQKALTPSSTIEERFDSFFVDYGIMPLYIYENIPADKEFMHNYLEAIDSISYSDLVQNTTRENSSWNLLTVDGLFSTVIPGVASKNHGYAISTKFPIYLGKLMKQKKLSRYYREISGRSVKSISVPPQELYDTTAPLLAEKFKEMLSGRKPDVQSFVEYLEELGLTQDDYEHIFELTMFGGDSKNPRKMPVSTSAKTMITKFYHSRHTDNQKKILKESDVRADYFISARPGNISRKYRKKKTSRKVRSEANDGDYDYDDYDFEGYEEYDGEFVLEENSKSKSKNTTKKSTKTKGRGKKKDESDELTTVTTKRSRKKSIIDDDEDNDEDDDGSDLADFIVPDDEVEEPKKKKKTQSKTQNQKGTDKKTSTWKPKTTVRRKPKPE
ncbi:differentiation specific element binding protein [Tritrichomonas foetus]|uniref:Replication factor C subunit 1 n=1 Tax=Tritrichomonas foetus TaxID=1144522 RepID=A0A1J4KL43_9EUKA|nr:differentiation specific element binding protein [Tritrichomonas foetus]|eukprot:OHT12015.1 differentiation specific element binding protein [Tritrichomonas foetus]